MALFELVVGLTFVGALFALLAQRLSVPYPALLAMVGAVLAFVPGAPEVHLDPELALALFVAPTLLDAAYDASPRDLRHHLVSIVCMAVLLVLLTVAAVAWLARMVVPDMSWASAIALGAIVAPPDASAANAVLRRLRPPHRLLVILEGESLFNDATALLVYRVAVGAAMTGVFYGWHLLPMLVLMCGGAIVLGWAIARIQIVATSKIDDIAVNVLLQFASTFLVWMIAEHAGLSAIIAVVVYAMTLARRLAGRMNARRRIASYAVWEVAVLVLNVLAFVLIGLQLRSVISHIHGDEWRTYLLCAAAVCAACVLVRIAWLMVYVTGLRPWTVRYNARSPVPRTMPTYQGALLASWCGMRGIVTIATALALPEGTAPFPHRDVIVFSAFCVVFFSLIVQGATLRPLMSWLGLSDDGTVEREVSVARIETARAAIRSLDGSSAPSPAARVLAGEYRARVRAEEGSPDVQSLAESQRQAVAAQRDALTNLRAEYVIGDDAFHVVEEEIDLLDLTADTRVRPDTVE